jgi:hypothetical protein
VGSVVKTQIVTDAVASNRSSLPCIHKTAASRGRAHGRVGPIARDVTFQAPGPS